LVSVTGATLPVWGPLAASPLRARWRARTYRSLEPLWSALHREFPQIALTSGGGDPGLAFLLYRRVIEILDGLLLLRPWLEPGIKDQALAAARTLTARQAAAVAEAAQITAALHAHAIGAPAVSSDRPHADPARTGLRSHATWLADVSAAMNKTTSAERRHHIPAATARPQRGRT
jgi:hypothetical protein